MARRVTINVNKSLLFKELVRSGNSTLSKKMKTFVDRKIEDERKELVSEFETHPVTREIDAGPTAPNISGLTGGYGNLFSFIGFENGSRPTQPIRSILKRRIKTTSGSVKTNGSVRISVVLPSLQDVFDSTPYPWASGSSWVQGIEKGISNLGNYFYDSKGGVTGSRSGKGVQTEKASSSSFKTTPYISKIVQDFKKKLAQL